MPMERWRYPENCEEIAFSVKEQADLKCEACGKQCRRPGEPLDTHRRTLTVAHMNHTPEDCRRENLKALCAPCHLRYDAAHHAETRKRRRRVRRGEGVSGELIDNNISPTDSDEREMPEHVKVVEPDSWDRLMFDINKQVSESDAKSFIARAKRLVVDDVENDCHD